VTRRDALVLGGATIGTASLASIALAQDGSDDDGTGDETGDDVQDDDADGQDDDVQDDSGMRQYRVTVANLTPGQPFTPPAVAAHRSDVEVFSVGEPANEAVQQLAENGNLEPLLGLIEETEAIRDAAVGDAPLVPEEDPGDTGNPYYTTLELSADASATHLTFLSMLVATNDGIVGLDTVPLPEEVNASRTYYANGYDVGTEENTEQFADLVPPAKTLVVGGEPGGTTETDPDLAEDGVIRPHPGIEGTGDLDPAIYDWREPAALVQVERIDGGPGTETPTESPTGPETATEPAPETETGTEEEPETESVPETETESEPETGTESAPETRTTAGDEPGP